MKTKQIGKILSLFLAVCLIFGTMPITAMAASSTMNIGGETVSLEESKTVTGWEWNATTNTLTLDSNYTGQPIAIDCQWNDTIHLVCKGNVSVSSSAASPVSCNGNLSISADSSGDTLTLDYTGSSSQYVALDVRNKLIIQSGTLTAKSAGSGTNPAASAIYASGGVTITGSASVTATTTGADSNGIATDGGQPITISTSGTVTANGTGTQYAFHAGNTVTVINISSGTVILTSENSANLYRGILNHTGGTLNDADPVDTKDGPLKEALEDTTAQTYTVEDGTILTKEVTLGADHTLTIPTGRTLTIKGIGKIILKDYTLTIKGGGTLVLDAPGSSLRTSNTSSTLKLENITVNIQQAGISVQTLDIGSGATVNLNSTDRNGIAISNGCTCTVQSGGVINIQDFWDTGIYVNRGTLRIDGGTVTIGNGQAGNYGIKIESSGILEYKGGSLSGLQGSQIRLSQGAKAVGLSGKLSDQNQVLNANDVTVVEPHVNPSETGLTAGGYYYTDNNRFEKHTIKITARSQDVTVTEGNISGSLSIGAEATNRNSPTYQWGIVGDGGYSFTKIPDATGSTFTIPTNLAAGTYTYCCEVEAINCSSLTWFYGAPEITVTVLPATAYTVTFMNGGAVYHTKTVTAPATTVGALPGNPVNGSYTFSGWYTGVNGTGTKFEASSPVTSSITVYAYWTGGGSGGGGGGGTATPAPTVPTVSGGTATTTVTPTITNGTATASVTQTQMNQALQQAQEAAKASGEKSKVEIKLENTANATSAAATIPQVSMKALATSGVDALTVSSGIGSVTFDAVSLATISGAASGNVTVSVASVETSSLPEAARTLVGDRPVYDLSVTSGGKAISSFGGTVTVSIPYTPAAGEDTANLVIYYISDSGSVERVPNARYDATTGSIVFTTTHFSYYAVGYEKALFSDVLAGAWYYDAVTFIAEKGITTGTGGGKFSPDTTLTRGQFIAMLLRAYGIEADANPADNFSDAGNTYYTGYLAAAKVKGIASGVGENKFAPEQPITRQEMFNLLYNALKVMGKLPTGDSSKILTDFTDSGDIASWAVDAMTVLVKSGTISGSGETLNPEVTSTRAQMAQVLYNLLGK